MVIMAPGHSFSPSHHSIVWLAAELSSYPFNDYAVLVIANTTVSKKYEELLGLLGVSISKDKLLVSKNGSLEFAKKFFVKGVQKDLSPISLRALLTVRSTLGMCQLYNIRDPNTIPYLVI